MKWMKYLKYVLPFAIGVAVIAVVYLVYKKFRAPYAMASTANDEQVAKTSTDRMHNGYTFYACAEQIYSMLYWSWWVFGGFSLKDTDEKALGALLLSVTREEYSSLCDVYLMIKKKNAPDNAPLTEDLMRTFNKTEQRMYLTHLINL